MLVLSRNPVPGKDTLLLTVKGVKIYVRVNGIAGSKVKLGITASDEVTVERLEIVDRNAA
jgi:sRNA-binding carbon storage regulator CsrA